MKKSFYITTTLPYVNSSPHIGFALEVVQADAIARYRRLLGDDVLFNFGTDEHGQKIFEKAKEEGKDPQKYTDEFAEKFKALKSALNLSYDLFMRTTDEYHKLAAQEFWKRCEAAGDIYKKNYKVKYCVGCELEKTDSELSEGKCPIHPNLIIELIEEENYFFRLSKYQDALLKLYKEHQDFLIPRFRLNEAISLIEGEGLQDFSISRLKSKMSWGVEVPNDPEHVMYVWFDALVSYISTLGWPYSAEALQGKPENSFEKFWVNGETVQIAGKDQVRQQAVMWQAMLMSASLPTTKQIFIHGFINSGGQKMSKSLGNVINPVQIVEEYGTDALRYFLLREIHPFEDSDFTMERFKEAYNANLANGIGNLTSRIMKMAEDNLNEAVKVDNVGYFFPDYVNELMDKYRIDLVMDYAWAKITELDSEIQEKKPWESKDKEIIKNLILNLYRIGCLLEPFMPETAKIIIEATRNNKKPTNLFLRK